MGEAGGHLDLAQEALGADLDPDFGAEDLEGDLAVVADIAGEKDEGHAALAQLAFESVAAGEARREPGLEF